MSKNAFRAKFATKYSENILQKEREKTWIKLKQF